jgi:hypothetical protein
VACQLVLDDLRGAPRVTVELGGTSARASDGLDVLERAFAELAAGMPRDEHGTSTIALEVVPSARAKWRWIQWTLQAAASPNARVSRVRLGSEGGELPAIEQSLPADRGAGSDPSTGEPAPVVSVSMRSEAREPGGDMTPRVGLHTELAPDRVTVLSKRVFVVSSGEPSPSELAHAMSSLSTWVLATAGGDPSGIDAVLEAPPPGGGDVPYAIAEAVVRTLRALGIREIRFVGAARPASVGSTSPR